MALRLVPSIPSISSSSSSSSCYDLLILELTTVRTDVVCKGGRYRSGSGRTVVAASTELKISIRAQYSSKAT
eukprot:2331469-Amphidinium_carterae.1